MTSKETWMPSADNDFRFKFNRAYRNERVGDM